MKILGTTVLAGARRWMVAAMAAAVVVGCGGGGGGGDAPAPSVGQATLGATGGTVDGPDGVQLVVPPSALSADTTLRIARDGSGAPELGGAKAITPVYAVTPHGTAFAESARISIPFKPEDVAPGTRPVILKSQPGGNWQMLRSETSGNRVSAADTDSLSFYAVGTCFITREVSVGGPDPLLSCPGAHDLTLVLLDGSGAEVPVPRRSDGTALPAATISQPQTLRYELRWTRPAGVSRLDSVSMTVFNAGLTGAQQPLRPLQVNGDFNRVFQTQIDPATVPNATTAQGGIVTLVATVSYTQDAYYLGCACFRPATWSFEARIPVRVIFTGTQPVITQQPQNRNVVAGQTAAFSVAATGANLSYQWSSFRGQAQTLLFGATQPSYTTSATTLADDNTFFTVEVCSNRGTAQQRCINSNAAVLGVTQAVAAPSFVQAPQAISVQSGQTASFSARANGQPAPTITWARVTSAPGAFLTTFAPICGSTAGSGTQTSANCTTAPLTLADNGARFVAQASNAGGSINSAEAVVTVTAPPVAPTITSPLQPDDRTITAGQSVSWTVTASRTAPLSYAWRTISPGGTVNNFISCANGVVPNQTGGGGSLTLTNVPIECNGYRFQAVVSNAVLPNATSRQALLTVNAPTAAPTLTTPLANRSVLDGTSVTFNVGTTGNPTTFTYAWTLDGAAIASPTSGCTSTSAACTFTARLADTGKTVRVVVANGIAPNATSQATLTVTTNDVAATITTQPANRTVVEGESASFTVGVAGTPTPTITWQTFVGGNWVDAGASTTTYTLAATTLAQNGLRVRALVGNTIATPGGPQVVSLTSSEATLAVNAANPAGMVLFAGDFSSAGTATGTGTVARFDNPQGLTADASGNLYVGSSNGKFVSKITPNAAVTHLFFAPITATSAFANPALAADGSLFVGSNSWCGLWRAAPPLTAPVPVTEITLPNCPVFLSYGLSVDAQGRVAIADSSRHAIIRATQQPGGGWTQTYFAGATDYFGGDANRGSTDANGTAARFSGPAGLAYAANGDLFVAELDNGTIRRITPAGDVSTFAGAAGQQSTLDGTGTAARFHRPFALAFDPDGNLIVLQIGASDADPAWVRRITPAGVVTTLFDARAEAAALATDGNAVANARQVKGIVAPGSKRIALSAGNAVLVRTLP